VVVSSNALASYPFKSARGEVLKLHGLPCCAADGNNFFLIKAAGQAHIKGLGFRV